jgi:hypothetical protein
MAEGEGNMLLGAEVDVPLGSEINGSPEGRADISSRESPEYGGCTSLG